MKVKNYKLENFFKALSQLKDSESMGAVTIFTLTKLMKKCEDALQPYIQVRNEIIKKNTVKGEDGKSVINNQTEIMSEITDLSMEETDIDLPTEFSLKLPAGSTTLDINLSKSMLDIFGDGFTVEEVK